ncbi:MAG: hypothetical protein ABSG16_07185 [Candidatus Acidiferrum sp.]|jgi:hypothetical protein
MGPLGASSMLLAWLTIITHIVTTPPATQSLSELQGHFDTEDNPVHKAKMMQKLADAQFDASHAAEKAEDYNTVGVTLEKYRDNIRAALTVLKKAHPDAEHKSNGYRQLQMEVHRGIREVEEALLASPEEFKPPLQLVRRDLITMNDEMLRLLFPKRPDPKTDAKPDAKPDMKLHSRPDYKDVQP